MTDGTRLLLSGADITTSAGSGLLVLVVLMAADDAFQPGRTAGILVPYEKQEDQTSPHAQHFRVGSAVKIFD